MVKNESDSASHASSNSTNNQTYIQPVYMAQGWLGQYYGGAPQIPPRIQGPSESQQPMQHLIVQGHPGQVQQNPSLHGPPGQIHGPQINNGHQVNNGQPVLPGQITGQGMMNHGPPYENGPGAHPPGNQYYQYFPPNAPPGGPPAGAPSQQGPPPPQPSQPSQLPQASQPPPQHQTGHPVLPIQPINQPPFHPYVNSGNVQEPSPTPTLVEERKKASTRPTPSIPRKRALTACDMCRIKKIKCDNVRPKCGSCTRNGVVTCQYRTDEHPSDEVTNYNVILHKLDEVLKEVQTLKDAKDAHEPKKHKTKHFTFDRCFWDMSSLTIMQWDYLKSSLNLSQTEINVFCQSVKRNYNRISVSLAKHKALNDRLSYFRCLEKVLNRNFPQIINSFFLNCHTKIPMLDMLAYIACLEMYTILKDNDEGFSMIKLVETQNYKEEVPDFYLQALKAANIEDTYTTRKSFRTLCKIVPILIMMCALGVLASSVQLDNLDKFSTSLEERESFAIGGLSDPKAFQGLEEYPRTRDELSYGLVKYASFLTAIYPPKQNSIKTVLLHILSSQYYLYVMSPVKAYKEISSASQNMMYYLEMKKSDDTSLYSIDPKKKDNVDRIFWTCLKLESELRVELSPYVPASGISQIVPPCNFPRIPEPVSLDRTDYSEGCLRLANKYYDEYSWHYFLTEIAVRKVENKMFDEIYSYQGHIERLWDQPEFVDESSWIIFIKYLNQYNGIINSLSPQIRNFVLQEINTDQIYRRIKKKHEKKQQNVSDLDIFDNLDDFLVDDDLLLQAQSESIMYIKTRILASKLMLFRPLIYLILEGKVSFFELVEAAMVVIKSSAMSSKPFTNLESPESSASTSSHTFSELKSQQDYKMDYFDLISAPSLYQKQYPDEDFSSLIEYNWDSPDRQGMDEQYIHGFRIKDMNLARARILRVFIQHLIAFPKLDIPKLGAHRHPGSWYYLRNMFIGNLYQFMLYRKIQEMVSAAMEDANFQAYIQQQPEISSPSEILFLIEMVISKESIQTMFEHSLLLLEYWKDESVDCGLYKEILQKCLAKL